MNMKLQWYKAKKWQKSIWCFHININRTDKSIRNKTVLSTFLVVRKQCFDFQWLRHTTHSVIFILFGFFEIDSILRSDLLLPMTTKPVALCLPFLQLEGMSVIFRSICSVSATGEVSFFCWIQSLVPSPWALLHCSQLPVGLPVTFVWLAADIDLVGEWTREDKFLDSDGREHGLHLGKWLLMLPEWDHDGTAEPNRTLRHKMIVTAVHVQ